MFKKNNEKGFTLIELMIVIAIIGILAAVAIPNFISYRNKAYCSSIESDAHATVTALASYFSDPDKITKPSITDLVNKEKLALSDSTDVSNSTITGTPDTNLVVKITKKATNKCPRGSSFYAYLGGTKTGGWK